MRWEARSEQCKGQQLTTKYKRRRRTQQLYAAAAPKAAGSFFLVKGKQAEAGVVVHVEDVQIIVEATRRRTGRSDGSAQRLQVVTTCVGAAHTARTLGMETSCSSSPRKPSRRSRRGTSRSFRWKGVAEKAAVDGVAHERSPATYCVTFEETRSVPQSPRSSREENSAMSWCIQG